MLGGNSHHFLLSLSPMAVLSAIVYLGGAWFYCPGEQLPLDYGNYLERSSSARRSWYLADSYHCTSR